MSITRRIITGTIASSASIAMNAAHQILTVPVLAFAWRQEQFGIGVMLTTTPTYFALTDLRFVQAATIDITMKTAPGERKAALETFQSIWLMFASSSAAIVAASLLLFIGWAFKGNGATFWVFENAPSVGLCI